MKRKDLKEILVPAAMLFVIALVCTALLAGTNMLTKDKIAQINLQTEMEAKSAVFPDAVSFSDANTVQSSNGDVTYYNAYDESGNTVGYVFGVTVKSYGGDLSAMIGISRETDKITGVEITEINDTPGLGLNVDNENFLSQYIGRAGNIGVNKNESNDNEIKAVSSATISSKAVTSAVNTAFETYETLKAGADIG